MNKLAVLFVFMTLFALPAIAQKGNNHLELIANMGIPDDQNDVGFGGSIKGLYGIGKSAQVTLTTGLSIFTSKKGQRETSTTRLIPFLAGYKQNIHKFYFEPQIGFGELGGKINLTAGDFARPSVGAFFWALAAGFENRRFDIGIRYQKVQGAEGSSAGTWYNRSFSFVGLHLGYIFF